MYVDKYLLLWFKLIEEIYTNYMYEQEATVLHQVSLAKLSMNTGNRVKKLS